MSLSLDHVVIRTIDLEQAIADFESLGFMVQRGGTHADGATHNALIGFADGSYIELISFLKRAPTHRWWDEEEHVGEGWVDFALLPRSVGTTIQNCQDHGLSYNGPIDGGRVRPDGERLAWQIGTPPSRDLPFLCADITPRHLRIAQSSACKHRNTAGGIASVSIAVNDLQVSITRYRALLGNTLTVHIASLSGYGIALATFRLSNSTVTLLALTERSASSALENVKSPCDDIRNQLAIHGEGVMGVTLHTESEAEARSLPIELTHGARLDLIFP